ncbi:cell division cycle, putative [Pediculus humanus corporis]|uniref:Cell division cycle, putative n=1 Tax=Pediculus humanus subsp. corporis TaxID=121224 RepID=E0VIJ6_PEDHC|nr:cell division cycle, putative [Pediculus humanus corporis]EEB13202.1 cell division cycle, putative [Pediculus humanus corporis]
MDNEMSLDVKNGGNDLKINLNYYRGLIKKYIELHRYNTALFWADKVQNLSKGQQNDVFWLAQALYLSKQYHRAAHLIKSKNLHLTNVQCCYLAASSLREAKEFTEAMEMLWEICSDSVDNVKSLLNSFSNNSNITEWPSDIVTNETNYLYGNCLAGSMHFERGRVYESLDNRDLATDCYKQALMADVHCFEAFDALIQHQMLTGSEEFDLINSLPFSKHCPSEVDSEFVRLLYENKLNKYRSINKIEDLHPLLLKLEGNLDLMVSEAEQHYYNCNFTTCWKITQEVMAKDPYHMTCLPIYISCLVELKNSNDLFLLAHKLVDIYPENAVSWFAVGCYYHVIGNKSDHARRFLGKATSLDKLFGPAWLAYGHSFAAENEHDQAMAAYFKASQIMKGCHLPLLYIGLENGLTNNSVLAEKFFLQAQAIAPHDPFVSHEMGVIAFQSGHYQVAKKHFEITYERVKHNEKTMIQSKWEPLLNNLGHVYRKLQQYEKAIEYHMQAMILSPNNASTYSAIGYCQVLMGQCKKAAELFHKALALKRDDTFSKEIFSNDVNGKKLKSNALPLMSMVDVTCDDTFKTPNASEDPNSSSKLSFEVEMADSNSISLDGIGDIRRES